MGVWVQGGERLAGWLRHFLPRAKCLQMLLVQLSASAEPGLRGAVDDGSSIWASATQVGELDGVPIS